MFAVKCLLRLFFNSGLQVKLQLAASQHGDELVGRCVCVNQPVPVVVALSGLSLEANP